MPGLHPLPGPVYPDSHVPVHEERWTEPRGDGGVFHVTAVYHRFTFHKGILTGYTFEDRQVFSSTESPGYRHVLVAHDQYPVSHSPLRDLPRRKP